MKRLSFLFRAVFVLLAVAFAGSCNTGGGGSGGVEAPLQVSPT